MQAKYSLRFFFVTVCIQFILLNSVKSEQQQQQQEDKTSPYQKGTGDRLLNVREESPNQASSYQYAVVIDCGSSGTRAGIYRWPKGARRQDIVRTIEPLRDATGESVSFRIRPGLSSVSSNPSAASDYMRPIMQFASKHVPVEQQTNALVYLFATAGLRLLSREQQMDILDDIARDVRIEFRFQNIDAEIISGSREGVYQWLSVNSLANRLNHEYDLDTSARARQITNRRLGVIEMGGASSQVTFEVSVGLEQSIRKQLKHYPDAWQAFQNSISKLRLYNDTINVFSATFLGFGSDAVRSLATDLLVRDSALASFHPNQLALLLLFNSTLLIQDPCLPIGANEYILKPLDLLYGRTKTIGYEMKSRNAGTLNVKLVGRGDFGACYHHLKRLIFVARKERSTCSNVDQNNTHSCQAPLLVSPFVPWFEFEYSALGELYYTPHDMLHGSSGRIQLSKLNLETARLCSMPLELIDANHSATSDFERRRNLVACFKATWILAWLITALRMPAHHWVSLTSVDRVNGNSIDLKLGALISKLVTTDHQMS